MLWILSHFYIETEGPHANMYLIVPICIVNNNVQCTTIYLRLLGPTTTTTVPVVAAVCYRR